MTTGARLTSLILLGIAFGAACSVRAPHNAVPATPSEPAPAASGATDTRPVSPGQPAVAGNQAVTGAVPPAAATAVAAAPAPPKAPSPSGPQAPKTGEAGSPYIFSPSQSVSAHAPAQAAAGAPAAEAADAAAAKAKPSSTSPPVAEEPPLPGSLLLTLVASAAEVAPGDILTLDVIASTQTEVVDAPLHLTFDPRVMAYVDGAPGDFLTQGGSSVVFLSDGVSRPGDVAVAAGRVERSQGASGGGLLCRVRLRGVAAGVTPILVGQAKAWGAKGERLDVVTTGTTAAVR